MTDAVAIFPPGFRVLDADGAPVSGAQIRFFEAGTSTPLDVFSDSDLSDTLGSIVYTRSDGYPVAEQASNTTVSVFMGAVHYKVDILDADGVTIYPAKDDQVGAVDTSDFLTSADTSTLVIPVTAIAVNTSIGAAHKGKLIQASGAITLTFGDPAVLGDDWNVRVRCNDATNPIKLVASAGAFKGAGFSIAGISLLGLGNAIDIICDGGNLIIDGFVPGRVIGSGRIFSIDDQVSSAPATTPGGWFIVTTGFSGFSIGDIIEATGQATFIGYTPPTDCGWLAFVKDENQWYAFQDSAWVAVFPPSSDTVAGIVELAVQSEMETATDVVRAVVPGRQRHHPSHPKARGRINTSGALIGASSGISGVVRNSAGNYTVTLTDAMADANYGVQAMAHTVGALMSSVTVTNATTFTLLTINSSFVATDSSVSFEVSGDMP